MLRSVGARGWLGVSVGFPTPRRRGRLARVLVHRRTRSRLGQVGGGALIVMVLLMVKVLVLEIVVVIARIIAIVMY